jgi:4-hydroxybenzoate polyprenyltransferase
MLRAWLELARISNLPTVWTNVTAGWLLAGGDLKDPLLAWLLLAGSLLYTGGMILNDAADARFDREHRKERPIPGGRVPLMTAWLVGLGMLGVGWLLAVFAGDASQVITAALVACILFYDLYHKPWSGAVWVMGLCRVLLFLMGGVACQSGFCMPWWLFPAPFAVALGAYVVGLTLVARSEAGGAAVPHLHATLARLLLWTPLLLAVAAFAERGHWRTVLILADFSPLLPLVLWGLFLAWTLRAMKVMKRGGSAIGQAVGLLLAGIPLVDALAVSQVSLPAAFGFAVLPPLLRLWQRRVAAT